jgi:4-hydroxy-2-oxoheptanedioate aldolase
MLTFAMIETADGLANVDAIVRTPGLDAVYIGPSDLSLALGGPPGQDSDAPMLMDAFDRILGACKAAGLKVGVHCASNAYARKMIERGFDLVTAGIDSRYMAAGKRDAAEMREWLQGR